MLRMSIANRPETKNLIGLVRAGLVRELILIDIIQQSKLNCSKQSNVLSFLIKVKPKPIVARRAAKLIDKEEKNSRKSRDCRQDQHHLHSPTRFQFIVEELQDIQDILETIE